MRMLERSEAEAVMAWMPVKVVLFRLDVIGLPRGHTVGVRRWLDCQWCAIYRGLLQPMEQLLKASGLSKADVAPQLYAQQLDDGLHVAGFVLPVETSPKPVLMEGEINRSLIRSLELAVEELVQLLLDVVAVEVGKETLLVTGLDCLNIFEHIIPGCRCVLQLFGRHLDPLFIVLRLYLVLHLVPRCM